MELQSRAIFIDTQYLMENAFNFQKEELKSLKELAGAGFVKVYMTDINDEEVKKHIKSSTQKGLERISQGDARVLKGIPAFWQFLKEYDENKSCSVLLDAYSQFKTECKMTILSTNDITMMEVYKKYALRQPPFGPGNKKNEFPDAFALLRILKWTYEYDSYAYVLSEDADWAEFSKQSWDNDPTNWVFGVTRPRVLYLKDLPTFLNMVYETEKNLKDLAQFWNKMIDEHTEEIERGMVNYEWAPEWSVDADKDEVYLINLYQVKACIVAREIIKVDREIAVYNIATEITVLVELEYVDYSNSVYDPEDGVHLGSKTKVKVHKITEPVIYECSFACTDGLEVNFVLTDVDGGPAFINLPFDHDNVLNLKEWTRDFKVYIIGVENGKITQSGEGSQEFDNFEMAKKVFPTLKLLKDSKDFTVMMDSDTPIWVNGPLTYYTEAAIEKMYGSGNAPKDEL